MLIHYLRNLEGKTLVLTHHNADIDAAASAIALVQGLKQIGKQAELGVAESVSRAARKLSEGHKFLIDPDCANFDNVILVDTSVPEQLNSVKNLKVSAIIDHHPEGKLTDGVENKIIDETKKSCAQMVYRILVDLNITIDKDLAKIIACGIVGDTAHLRLAEQEEFKILVELFDTGLKYSEVLETLQSKIDLSERVACLKAATRANLYRSGEVIVAVSNVVSHEAASCRALLRSGADISVVIASKKDTVRVSSRGKREIKEKIDLSEVFGKLGEFLEGSGGGHDLAGSANGKKRDRREIEKFLIKQFSEKFPRLERLD
jgi:nanoRNase/pAp phosphatase (c-di-AMP/oligoRNAs hydrolase)